MKVNGEVTLFRDNVYEITLAKNVFCLKLPATSFCLLISSLCLSAFLIFISYLNVVLSLLLRGRLKPMEFPGKTYN